MSRDILKKMISLFLALTMVCGLTACGGQQSAEGSDQEGTERHIVLKIGIEGSENSNDNRVALKIKELVEEDPSANIEVQVFGDGQLGSLRDLIEGLSLNTVGMTLCGLNGFENICPNMGVFSPWMIDSPETAVELYESDVGQQLRDQLLNENGIRMMSYCNCISGTTYLWGNKPYTTLADYKGVNIRSNNSASNITALGAFGANPVVLGFADVYNGIETGLIDMTWGSVAVVLDGGQGEVLDYIMPAASNFTAGGCAVSEMLWSSMSANQQQILTEAVTEACQVYGQQLHENDVAEEASMLEEYGIEVVEMNDSDYEEMCRLVTEATLEHLSDTCDADVLSRVSEMILG